MIATEKLYRPNGPLGMLFVKRDQPLVPSRLQQGDDHCHCVKHPRLGVGPSGIIIDRLKRKIRPHSLSSTLDRRSDETQLQKVPLDPARSGAE